MYINSLPGYLQDTNTYLYADDTAILKGGSNIAMISRSLELELARANEWLKDHKLSLNSGKTKIMYFRTPGKLANDTQTAIQLERAEISCVEQYKCLVMMQDCNLKFNKHVQYLESKI